MRIITLASMILALASIASAQDVQFLELHRLWEVGAADDEDVIFGVISSVAVDAEGNVFVLDRQLTEVSMFSADGEYLGPVGREGEGPGEYSRVGDLFVSRPGELGVVQRMPGRIVSVRSDGTPGQDILIPEAFRSAPAYFYGAARAGTGLVLSARQLSRTGEGVRMTTALIRVGADGEEVARLVERTQVRDMAALELDEKTEAEVVWAADEYGSVYLNEDFDAYEIAVYAPDGSMVRTIRRDFEHRQRTEREKELNTPRMRIRRREGGGRSLVGTPSPTDRDVQAIFPRPDGTVWVLNSRGAFDVPEGVLASFDVFDQSGDFVRQIAVRGEGSFREDGFHLIGDRLFVTRGFQAALRAERGLASEDEDLDAEPMSVICYELGAELGTVAGGQ
jgi:hypothetical protein